MLETLFLGLLLAVFAYGIYRFSRQIPDEPEIIDPEHEEKLAAAKQKAEQRQEAKLLNLEILLADAEQAIKDERHEAAAKKLDRALELFPDSARVYLARANLYLDDRKFAFAIEAAHQVIELDPLNAQAYNAIGLAAFAQKDYETAASAFEHAITIDDTKTTRFINLALSHRQLGNFKKEIGALKKVLELDPGNLEYLKLLVEAAQAEDDKSTAKEALAQYLAAEPGSEWAKRELAKYE